MKFLKWLPLCALTGLAAAALFAQSQQNTAGAGANGTQTKPAVPADQRLRRAARDFLAIGAPPDPAAVERGQKIFVSTCAFCHGTKANGGEGGPDLIRSVLVLHDNNGSNIGPVILHGRPGKGMPAFSSMTPAQISDIAAFLKSKSQEAANRMDYKIQNIVTGDAKAGEAYFNGAGKCNTCHSPTGDLAGIADKYDPVSLQARFLFPRIHSYLPTAPQPETAVKATVTLPSGKTISGTVDHIDDFNISLVDATGNYHSFPLDGNDAVKVKLDDPLAAHAELLKTYTDADMHNVLAYLETLK
jgi:cytochrome c oxidase cbb3-type subunit III